MKYIEVIFEIIVWGCAFLIAFYGVYPYLGCIALPILFIIVVAKPIRYLLIPIIIITFTISIWRTFS